MTHAKKGNMTEATQKTTRFNKTRLLSLIVCLLIGGIVGSVSVAIRDIAYTSPHVLTSLFLAALFLTILIYLLILKMKEGWEITDARLIFAVFFLLYGICPPLLGRQKWDVYSDQINMYAAFCFWLGSLGILASLLFSKKSNAKMQEKIISPDFLLGVKLVSIAGFLIGVFLLMLDYGRFGNIFELLAMKRGVRTALISATRGNLPYHYLLFVSSSMYFYSIVYSAKWRTVKNYVFFGLAVLPIITLWLLEGERGNILTLGLILLAVWSSRFLVEVSIKWVIVFVHLWILFSFIGYIRGAVTMAIRTHEPKVITSYIEERAEWRWFYPREFAGPYLTLTASIDRKEELKYGQTYLQSIPYLLPRSLYPGEKPLTVGHEFGKYMQLLVERERKIGVGFLPVAEAYINFGWIGPALMMFLIGICINYLSSFRKKKGFFWIILYVNLLPLAWRFNRTGFANCFSYMIYNIGTLVFLYILILFFTEAVLLSKEKLRTLDAR